MARASEAALDRIADILAAARAIPALTEKGRGIFYRRSAAHLHFHEEDGAVIADLKPKPGSAFVRFALATAPERARFLKALSESVA